MTNGQANHAWKPRDIKIIPTFVVGVGGTGVSAIRHLKRRVRLDWPRIFTGDMPELVQFYGVDTVSYANRPGQEFLSPHEYTFIGGFDPQQLLGAAPGAYPSITPPTGWWDFGNNIPAGIVHLGARQIRALGRLALFQAFPDVWLRITDKIRVLNAIQAGDQATRYGFTVPAEPSARQVFVVASLCGGTGSGCFLDVAARIRATYANTLRVIGIFVLPSAFSPVLPSQRQIDRTHANAFAALKELDAFWYANRQHQFTVQYPGEPQASVLQHGLFDEVYLIGRNSRRRSLSTLDDVNQQIAHFLYLSSFHTMADPAGERKDNFNRIVPNVQPPVGFYSSFGVGALSIPQHKIADSLLSALQARYLRNIINDQRHTIQLASLQRLVINFSDRQFKRAEDLAKLYLQAGADQISSVVRPMRIEIAQQTLRWIFHEIVPAFGLAAVPEVARLMDQEYGGIQKEIAHHRSALTEAQRKRNTQVTLDQVGRAGSIISRFRGLKTVEEYDEEIDEQRLALTIRLLLATPKDERASRMLDAVLDVLEPMSQQVTRFLQQIERLAIQAERAQNEALLRESKQPTERSDGHEASYYDCEIDPTLPGDNQAYTALMQRVLNISELSQLVSVERALVPLNGSDNDRLVIAPLVAQLLGLHDGRGNARRTGHAAPPGEVATFLDPKGVPMLLDREDWEIESMLVEHVLTTVNERLNTQAGLLQFFAQPAQEGAERRQAMQQGLRARLEQMMNNVEPFWEIRTKQDESGFERVRMLSMAIGVDSGAARDLLREYVDKGAYQVIRGTNPFRLDALYIEHAARPIDIAEFLKCAEIYEAFERAQEHTQLHLRSAYSTLPNPLTINPAPSIKPSGATPRKGP
ncbi:MAG: hypothetical protein OHK0022_19480 [Roseiflexaceae bacterium]